MGARLLGGVAVRAHGLAAMVCVGSRQLASEEPRRTVSVALPSAFGRPHGAEDALARQLVRAGGPSAKLTWLRRPETLMSTVAFPERAMTEESLHIPRLALQRALAQTTWLVVWRLVQTGALAAAAFFTYRGAQILDQDPQTVQFFFDEGAPWLGLALLATLVAAWEPALPRLSRPWSAMLAHVWRAHRLELALLALIFAFGVFMRVYRFGDPLPPADAL